MFLVNFRNYVDRQIAFRGDYERLQHDYFFGEMTRRRCKIFIDVGANIGLYSVLAALRHDPPRIVAFEPDQRNYDQLRANLLLNRLTFVVETHLLAVSDSEAVTFRCAPESSTGQSRVDEDAEEATLIPAVMLDRFLELSGLVVFIKIDIEGHELPALRGMARLLRRNKCFLQVESFDRHFPPVRDFLEAAGYRVDHQIGNDRFFANF